MKKRLISLAVASAFIGTSAMAADSAVEVTGFVDVIYTAVDEFADDTAGVDPITGGGGDNPNEKKFDAEAELDVIATPADGVTARIDMDLDLTTNDGSNTKNADSGRIEQAFFAWGINEQFTFIGGVFNNPIGQEEEDAPDINFTNHSLIFNILDNQTALYGNNLAGIAGAGAFGPFTITLAFLDDIQEVDEENSIAAVVNYKVQQMEGLEFEAGYVTQEKDGTDFVNNLDKVGAGDVWDINGSWNGIMGSKVSAGFDYLGTSEVIDGAYNVWAGFEFGQGFVVRGRYEGVSSDVNNVNDITAYSLYAAWKARTNLLIALEYRATDAEDLSGLQADVFNAISGTGDGDMITAEFIATLP